MLVYDEADAGFFVSIGSTENRRFIVISTGDHVTTEVRLIDAFAPEREPVLVAAREHGHEYIVHAQGDDLVIVTNADGAEDFKIVRVPAATPERAHWRPWVPHVPGRLIERVRCFAGEVVRLERADGLQRLVVQSATDAHTIAFGEAVYALSLHRGFEYDTSVLRFCTNR